jgi:hypothetical protein
MSNRTIIPVADSLYRFKRPSACSTNISATTRWAVWDNRGLPAKRLAISGLDDIESVRTLIAL